MKNAKYLGIGILFSLLLFTVGCSKDNQDAAEPNEAELDNLNEKDFPIVEEEIDLKFMAGQAPATNPDWNDVMMFNEYEEMTNMNIEWEMVSHETLDEKRNLAFGGGKMPDAFHSAGIESSDLMKYGEQGMLLSLNDLIEDYAPNFQKVLEEYPEVEKSVTMPDGNIYGFPLMGDPDFLSYRIGPKPFINKEWLDSLGMDMPETTADYYAYLKAVKEEDPGDNDGIPFGGPNTDSLYAYLKGSFGLSNKGSSGGLIDLDPESDDYRFYPTADEYKELLEYMNMLYEEELIEKNVFSIDHHQYLANSADGRYGNVIWYSPTQIMGNEVGSQYVGMPALEGPHGDKEWVTLSDPVLAPGAFVLTSENDNPAATIRWIDYFYGDEGKEFFFMGIEGETYELDDDGNPEYMDHILNSADGLTYEEELAKYLTFPGGGFPSVTSEEFFKGAESSEESLAAADLLAENFVEDAWVGMPHTKEENDELRGHGTDIEKYVEEMREKFISGDESFDSWDKYVSEIEKMGLEDYMKIKIDTIERQFED